MRIDTTAWMKIQYAVWTCEHCRGNERVACDIRQQTGPPDRDVNLLIVGIAPPFETARVEKVTARSATNHSGDNLRKFFILPTLSGTWETLLARGVFMIHSVKCAITPKDHHQNPPDDVVDACAPPHFVQEVELLRPPRVIVLGKAPYRALLQIPGLRPPRGLGVSASVAKLVDRTRGGLELQADGWRFKLHVSPFPLAGKKPISLAQDVLREAADLAGISQCQARTV
jgi:uracil-DNA glycosylase